MASYDVASIICQALPEESCPLARAGAGRGGVVGFVAKGRSSRSSSMLVAPKLAY
jgi:hypothetical protein